MRKINRPIHQAGDTFQTCISRVRDKALRERLLDGRYAIEHASLDYDRAAQNQVLHEFVSCTTVNGNISSQEMQDVYEQRMVKKESPGRPIYNELLQNAPLGSCPYCAQRIVSTIDHFLPKSSYPVLSVAPLNLVPCCKDCNDARNAYVPKSAADVPPHPYYDDIDTVEWLVADVIEQFPPALRFEVIVPTAWDTNYTNRIKTHFRILDLETYFATEAARELLNISHQLNGLFLKGGINAVRTQLCERAESLGKIHRNSWQRATYLACAKSDWFCSQGFAMNQ